MEQHPDSPAVGTATAAASLEASLNPAPAPAYPLVPQPPAGPEAGPEPEPPIEDQLGLNPAEFEWLPVLRKPRKDGWTPQRQVEFIATLADTGCVESAAQAVSMSVSSCYRLRRAPEAAAFAQAWDIALQHAAKRLLDQAFQRAINGTHEPVYDRMGNHVGHRMRHNDRLLMFLLRAFMPERFRHANRDGRDPAEPLPPPPEPLEGALERLAPPPPPEPHRLMPPEELAVALECAELGDGELPHWHRGEANNENPWPDSPLGEEFERMLAESKQGRFTGPSACAAGKGKGTRDGI